MHILCLQQIKIMWNLFSFGNDNNNNIAKTMMAIIWKRNSFSFYDSSIDMFLFFFANFFPEDLETIEKSRAKRTFPS